MKKFMEVCIKSWYKKLEILMKLGYLLNLLAFHSFIIEVKIMCRVLDTIKAFLNFTGNEYS